jgi:hypothetical protein
MNKIKSFFATILFILTTCSLGYLSFKYKFDVLLFIIIFAALVICAFILLWWLIHDTFFKKN